jgi:hypothetical protein
MVNDLILLQYLKLDTLVISRYLVWFRIICVFFRKCLHPINLKAPNKQWQVTIPNKQRHLIQLQVERFITWIYFFKDK